MPDLFNSIGLEYDKQAPTGASDVVMCQVSSNDAMRHLEAEVSALRTELEGRYGKASRTLETDYTRYL